MTAEPLEPPAGSSTQALSRALLVEAARILPLLAPDARENALVAIDAFVAVPLPSRWLAAVRTLRQLRRRARGERNVATLAARSFARGLERIQALELLDDDARATLAALPVDAGAGRRLEALAQLVAAHQELAGRVRDADATRRTLKAEIELATSQPPERRRRR